MPDIDITKYLDPGRWKVPYIVVVLFILAIVGYVTGALIAWPALAYLGAKLFG